MNRSHIIPFPPDYQMLDTKFVERETVGLYRCDNDPTSEHFCPEYRVIMVTAAGRLAASCSNKLINTKGCTRKHEGIRADMPEQTYENYQRALALMDTHWPVPTAYKMKLAEAWAPYAPAANSPEDTQRDTQGGNHDA